MDPQDFEDEGRLLIVDDDQNIIRSYRRLFFDSPYQIEYAGNGEEAVRLAQSLKPHIVLLDIMMPGMDGYSVCEQILSNPETGEAEIIFISAKADDADRLKAYSLGADDFIAKPVNPDELISKIVAKLRRRSSYLSKIMIDPLTGLGNRRHLERSLEKYMKMADMYGKSLVLTILDIDFFKKVNDTYGHDVGDIVLTSLAALLKNNLRGNDTVARFGGEEFVILMPGLDPQNAFSVLDRHRREIASTPLVVPGKDIELYITVSMGAAFFPLEGTDPETLFKIADENLYQAKGRGRNIVVNGIFETKQDNKKFTVRHKPSR